MSWCDNLSIFTWLISWDTKALTVFIYSTTNESGIYFTPNYFAKLPIKLNCILYIYFCSYSNNRKVTVIVSFSFERRTVSLFFLTFSNFYFFILLQKLSITFKKKGWGWLSSNEEVKWLPGHLQIYEKVKTNSFNLASFCKGFSQKKKNL